MKFIKYYITINYIIITTIGCSTYGIIKIKTAKYKLQIDTTIRSKNFDSRITHVILHHTGGHTDGAMYVLLGLDSTKKVSAHYFTNNHLSKNKPNYIYRIINEDNKSWHAGLSGWKGNNNLNASSIGIENVNINGNEYEYTENQILSIINLCKYLKYKYNILDVNFLGHSDIAIGRKIDPGIKFPWKRLYENGVGAWYDSKDVDSIKNVLTILPPKDTIISKLIEYGYTPIDFNYNIKNINDIEYKRMIYAFKSHFIQDKINSKMDLEDYAILLALLKKYR